MGDAPQPTTQVIVQTQPSNGLGVAGFIVSLLGLVTCGCIGPIGLLLSFIALFKAPRGFAIAGTILGFIGSIWLWIGGAGIIMGLLTGAGGALGVAQQAAEEAERQAKEQQKADLEPAPAVDPTEIDLGQQLEPPESEPVDQSPAKPSQLPETEPTVTDPELKLEPMPKEPAAPPAEPPESETTQGLETPPDDGFRTWTDATGQFKIDARFVTVMDGTVHLRKRDGETLNLPMDKLSATDQEWVTAEIERRKNG